MSPFERQHAKEIYVRDGRTCQNPDCVVKRIHGVHGSIYNHFNIHAAHYPNEHKDYEDDDITNGRVLDMQCHLIEELQRGNTRGARLMYSQHSVRTTQWRVLNGFKDERAPFEWYVDYAEASSNGDELGMQGLIKAYQENYTRSNPARGQQRLF